MPPVPAILHRMLRHIALRLALLLGGVLAVREGRMRARLAAMPVGHRHRARLMRDLASMARVRAALADPEFREDPRTIGKAAEVGRCVNDAGRRAVARRFGLMFSRGRGMRRIARGVALAADPVAMARCTGFRSVA
ncbi:MAG: hypothetical protein NT133_18915 [Alphaproteobacteria bacterium]|nr:hypothetical protein [Alphaproteobacteria bacterium]